MTTLAALLGIAALIAYVWGSKCQQQLADAIRRNEALNASISRHLSEGVIYGQEVAQLERRNAWLEQKQRVIMARWWKRRHYRTLSTWKVTGGVR